MQAARSLKVEGMTYGVGDIVIVSAQIHEVRLCVRANTDYMLMLQPFELVRLSTSTASVWRRDRTASLKATKVKDKLAVHAHCWYWQGEDRCFVLHEEIKF